MYVHVSRDWGVFTEGYDRVGRSGGWGWEGIGERNVKGRMNGEILSLAQRIEDGKTHHL